MDPALETALSKLRSVANQLNIESDELNEFIRKLNSQIADMKVGVSCWENKLLEAHRDGESESGWILGYQKFQDAWGLAVKRAFRLHVSQEVLTHDDQTAISLLGAPRIVRIQAIGRIPEFIVMMIERLELCIDGIRRAKSISF